VCATFKFEIVFQTDGLACQNAHFSWLTTSSILSQTSLAINAGFQLTEFDQVFRSHVVLTLVHLDALWCGAVVEHDAGNGSVLGCAFHSLTQLMHW